MKCFSVDGSDVKKPKKKQKKNYNSQLEYRKTSRGANEISKLPQAKCLRAKIDETCNKFREQCRFFSQKKTQRRRKVTLLFVEVEYVCWPRTEARRKKKLSAKCFREGTKVKKVKNDKKRIVCGFHFKEHHFKRESDRETLRISGRFTTKG